MKILVTGSSRGIGKAISERLLKEGISVIGTSRSVTSPISDQNYTHIQCDLQDELEVLKVKELFKGNNIPEAVINNAGIFMEADFNISDEEWLLNWDKTLQVNLRSAALICKWALNEWKERGIEGRIINISSRAGYRGDTQEFASYAASKGGMVAFTKSIARSFGKLGITAYTIAPGFVETDMARESINTYGEEYLTKDLALSEIAPPEQIAEMANLLVQGKLKHATGQTFHINSGSYLI